MFLVSLAASPCTPLCASRSLPAKSTNTSFPCRLLLKPSVGSSSWDSMYTVSKLRGSTEEWVNTE